MSLPTRAARIPGGRLTKWLVLALWIGVVTLAAPLAGKVGEVEDNDAASFLPRSAEATQVTALAERFTDDERLPAVIVYARDGGVTAVDRAAVEADRVRFAELVPGAAVPEPVVAPDGEALLLAVPLAFAGGVSDAVEQMRAGAADGAPPGLDVAVTGPAGALVDQVAVFDDLDVTLLLASAAVVAVLLLLTYRSPVLWLLPLVSVGVATQVANAVIYLLGRHAGLPVDGQSAGILTVLVFGVGTDYALLLVSRYREELHRHADRHAAMAVALRRAGPAIVASAATVVAGLLCLFAADLNSTRSLGGVGAIGVAAGMAVMVTLLPALLVLVGRWAFWPFVPREGTPVRREGRGWDRVGAALARRPRAVWSGTALALAAIAVAATGLNLGLTQEQAFRSTPESVVGQRLISDHFPGGRSAPSEVVADAAAAQPVADAVRATPGVATVLPAEPSTDRTLVRIPVVLTDPPDSPAAESTVLRLRDAVDVVPGALVGGPTATTVDVERAAESDRARVIPLALGVVLLILVLLLRSLVAPLLLIGTVVLSFFAALGTSTLLFESVFDFDAVDHSLPLLGFVFLVALGVDYNIFLMTRVREETQRLGHAEGVLRGLASTGGVITSAGLVLAATFAVFVGLPVVFLAAMGVLVAVGVLLDTFVVRSLLVPALALDLGRRIWWPGALARQPTVAGPPPVEPPSEPAELAPGKG